MGQKFKRALRVTLTPEEIQSKAGELADLMVEYSETESKRKADAASYSARLKSLDTQAQDIAQVIKAGEEERQVECEERRNFETSQIQIIRLDTGALVSERTMTAEEKQGDFFDPIPPVAGEDDDEEVTLEPPKRGRKRKGAEAEA